MKPINKYASNIFHHPKQDEVDLDDATIAIIVQREVDSIKIDQQFIEDVAAIHLKYLRWTNKSGSKWNKSNKKFVLSKEKDDYRRSLNSLLQRNKINGIQTFHATKVVNAVIEIVKSNWLFRILTS